MTQEEKELLLVDLCARLPYNVKVLVDYIDESNVNDTLNCLHIIGLKNYTGDDGLINIKPYLRSMSSMTEEERNDYIIFRYVKHHEWDGHSMYTEYVELEEINDYFDWLNAHHFDYRGLIEKGLAIEAPEGMYNTKTE